MRGNTFSHNGAREGGVFHYKPYKPRGENANTYFNNTAIYGQLMSSIPAYIEMAPESLFENLASGQAIPHQLVYRIKDLDNQTVATDNLS